MLACGLALMAIGPFVGCASIEAPGATDGVAVESDGRSDARAGTGVRAPAEWETQAAIWMQWPGEWESAMRPAFAATAKTASPIGRPTCLSLERPAFPSTLIATG